MGLTMQNPRSIEQAALEGTHKNLEAVKQKEKIIFAAAISIQTSVEKHFWSWSVNFHPTDITLLLWNVTF